ELRRTRHQRRSRRSNHRHTRSRSCDVRLALGTNPNLPARRGRELAGLAGSLRVAHMITALIFVPLAGSLFVSAARPNHARGIALGFNALTAILAFILWRNFDGTAAGLQLIERHVWIPAIGAEYLVGLDGLSLLLVLLTSLIIPFASLAQPMERGATALMLVMQSALYGTVTAQNLVLWFLVYDMTLI